MFKVLVVLAFVLAPSFVLAQGTIGTVFNNMGVSINPLPRFMVGFCYIMGVVGLGIGLMKLRDTVIDPGKNKVQSAVAALVVGALLIGLPYAIRLGGSLSGADTTTASHTTLAPANRPTLGQGFNGISR